MQCFDAQAAKDVFDVVFDGLDELRLERLRKVIGERRRVLIHAVDGIGKRRAHETIQAAFATVRVLPRLLRVEGVKETLVVVALRFTGALFVHCRPLHQFVAVDAVIVLKVGFVFVHLCVESTALVRVLGRVRDPVLVHSELLLGAYHTDGIRTVEVFGVGSLYGRELFNLVLDVLAELHDL